MRQCRNEDRRNHSKVANLYGANAKGSGAADGDSGVNPLSS